MKHVFSWASAFAVVLGCSSALCSEAPAIRFGISVSGGTRVPVEWVYRDVKRDLVHGSELVLSWTPEGCSADWGDVAMEFAMLQRGAELMSFGKDLLSVRLLNWSADRGGTLRVYYRPSLLAYVARRYEDFEVLPTGQGYALLKGGREVRKIRLDLSFPFLRSPGVDSVSAEP